MKVYVAIWTWGEKTSDILGVFFNQEGADKMIIEITKQRSNSHGSYGSVEEHIIKDERIFHIEFICEGNDCGNLVTLDNVAYKKHRELNQDILCGKCFYGS